MWVCSEQVMELEKISDGHVRESVYLGQDSGFRGKQ